MDQINHRPISRAVVKLDNMQVLVRVMMSLDGRMGIKLVIDLLVLVIDGSGVIEVEGNGEWWRESHIDRNTVALCVALGWAG